MNRSATYEIPRKERKRGSSTAAQELEYSEYRAERTASLNSEDAGA
jgi:hypothetical protein